MMKSLTVDGPERQEYGTSMSLCSRSGTFIATIVALAFASGFAKAQDDLSVWREFIQLLRIGQVPVSKIRPHAELGDEYTHVLLGFLDSVRTQAAPGDWTAEPEIIRAGNKLQYIIPWSAGGQRVSYCFSFVIEDTQWYFQHIEAVFIRLDKVSQLPTSEFPDVSEPQKNWAREEIYWSFVVMNYYLPLAKEKGPEYALSMLKDGAGYFVGAKTWVPFVPPHKAFILYLCWEQARLRGNTVTLDKLDDTEAIVRMNTHFFALYFAASHLKPRISIDDYKRIFETIWQDRALSAGWRLTIQYSEDYNVTFTMKRSR